MIHIYDANAVLRSDLNRTDGLAALSPRMFYNRINAATTPEIWVWDGPNNNDLRRSIFPGYKIRDYAGMENVFEGLQIYRRLLTHSNAVQIEVPCFEADDVCATLARSYAGKNQPVTIHTSDFDFFQLSTNPLITLKGVRPIEGVPAQYVQLYKALRGDTSDKIPGIPGFGHKTFEKFRELWPDMDRALRHKNFDQFQTVPFKPAVKAWVAQPENFEVLCSYYEITQMFNVPMDLIGRFMSVGQYNPSAAQEIFTEFFL